ncbi:Leishmanolysin-like peptidase, partial [Blattella germanica]
QADENYDTKTVIHGVQGEPAHIVKKRSIDQPLRILLYYDESVYRCESSFHVESIRKEILSTVAY